MAGLSPPVQLASIHLAPIPTELFVTGLTACVGFYAERYPRRHGLDPTGLVVDCDFDFSDDRSSGVSDIRIAVTAHGLPEGRRELITRLISTARFTARCCSQRS